MVTSGPESHLMMIKADLVLGQGLGTGKCHVSGPSGRADDALVNSVRIAHSFIRLYAEEMINGRWFLLLQQSSSSSSSSSAALAQQLRESTKDVVVRIEGAGYGGRGGSSSSSSSSSLLLANNNSMCGLSNSSFSSNAKRGGGGGLSGTGGAVLIALLQAFLGVQPLAGVAIAADITLAGKIISAGGLVTRVKAALASGIERLIVSREEEDEACRRLDSKEREILIFAEDVFDLLEYAVIGK